MSVTGQADTRTRIVDAAARLLQEQGVDGVTTRAVAQAAGVQPPMIYRLFGDKDGLLDAVAEHVMATFVAAKSEVVEAAEAHDVDPVEDLRDGWRTQIDFGLANPTMFAMLSLPTRGRQSPAALIGLELLRARIGRIAATGRLRVAEPRAVDLIRAAGSGAILVLLSAPPEERDPGLADAMLETVLREILLDADAAPEHGLLPAAVTLRAHAPRLDVLSEAERGLLAEWLDRAIGS